MKKGLFHRFAQGRTGWSLVKTDFTEKTDSFANPARGWYQLYTFIIEKEPDFIKLKKCFNEEESLVLALIDISSYYDRDLDQEAISRMERILEFFGEHKKDVVLRVTYDHEGKALEKEPSSFRQVQMHLRQLGELFEKYHQNIFVYQGMLVGNWGEMHTSRFLGTEQLRDLNRILSSYRRGEMFLAVRRPVQWRKLHARGLKHELESDVRMGLYDDGIFGSSSNLGTFGLESKDSVGWEQSWIRQEELAFEDELCKKVPNGGEALYSEDYSRVLSQNQTLQTLTSMHITYLNRKHDIRLLDLWKQNAYTGSGVWAGKSMYDYIGAHLGYRFWVKRGQVSAGAEGTCQIEIEIQNIGFANLYQETELYLEWTDTDGNERRKMYHGDMRSWNSGSVQKIVFQIEPSQGMLYLSAKRKWDGMRIRFANWSDKSGRVIIGHLENDRV